MLSDYGDLTRVAAVAKRVSELPYEYVNPRRVVYQELASVAGR